MKARLFSAILVAGIKHRHGERTEASRRKQPGARCGGLNPAPVMPGLVPGIHAARTWAGREGRPRIVLISPLSSRRRWPGQARPGRRDAVSMPRRKQPSARCGGLNPAPRGHAAGREGRPRIVLISPLSSRRRGRDKPGQDGAIAVSMPRRKQPSARCGGLNPATVVPGLVPGIHAAWRWAGRELF